MCIPGDECETYLHAGKGTACWRETKTVGVGGVVALALAISVKRPMVDISRLGNTRMLILAGLALVKSRLWHSSKIIIAKLLLCAQVLYVCGEFQCCEETQREIFLHGVQIFGKNVIVFTKICITCIIRYCANDKGTRRDRRKYWQRKISVVLSIF